MFWATTIPATFIFEPQHPAALGLLRNSIPANLVSGHQKLHPLFRLPSLRQGSNEPEQHALIRNSILTLMTTISAELLDSGVRQLRTDTHCSICRVQLRQETSNEQRKERVREQECLAVCAHAWLSDLLLLWGNRTAQISLSGVSYTPTHPGPQTMPRKLYLYSTVFNFIRMVWPTLKKKEITWG